MQHNQSDKNLENIISQSKKKRKKNRKLNKLDEKPKQPSQSDENLDDIPVRKNLDNITSKAINLDNILNQAKIPRKYNQSGENLYNLATLVYSSQFRSSPLPSFF